MSCVGGNKDTVSECVCVLTQVPGNPRRTCFASPGLKNSDVSECCVRHEEICFVSVVISERVW